MMGESTARVADLGVRSAEESFFVPRAPRTESPCRLAFDEFLVDLRSRRLYAMDRVVPIEPRAFDVLVTLASRSPWVVHTRELLDLHWRNEAVCRGVIWQCVWQIRKALGDRSDAPRFIRTVARVGYQFIATVRAESE